ncbi:MAG: hypothetical protein DMC57_00985 [Verrucomicrobia bacterium]|nr:MAG: hypothetical protein DMC57_00985 [Verrucomicrobiota bacterium]
MSDWGVFPLAIARGLAGSSCSHLAMQKRALRVTIRRTRRKWPTFRGGGKKNAPPVLANGGTERRV